MLMTQSALRKDHTSGLGPLQHRHFATIAAIIREAHVADQEGMAHHFARLLRGTNPKFDRARFLRACGLED